MQNRQYSVYVWEMFHDQFTGQCSEYGGHYRDLLMYVTIAVTFALAEHTSVTFDLCMSPQVNKMGRASQLVLIS